MSTKLWAKEKVEAPAWLEEFTAGGDKQYDMLLAEYDVTSSMAHAGMLAKVGLLTHQENLSLQRELANMLADIQAGKFRIEEGVEDIHSQIELGLTRKLGDVGRKIHTGRSRNDQVLTAIKLYLKDALKGTAGKVRTLFDLLQRLSEAHSEVLLPGYTHLQIAMPSSFGLWFGAYAESLSEDTDLLVAAYRAADRNPLGSGAGYGSSLPLDRQHTTVALNFATMNYNSAYAQMTRGKTEKVAATALAAVAATLAKMSMDICLYLSQNFNFVSFPDELTTGSSIMPHKKNPDVFELIRAKCNKLQAIPGELTILLGNLPSGYQRDLQLTKESIFPAFKTLNECLDATVYMLEHIRINDNILSEDKYAYLFSVEKVNQLVKQGISFREAYRNIGQEIAAGLFEYTGGIEHTHQGSIGNLMNAEIRQEFYARLRAMQLA